ncbi:flagellar basal body P-ring formation chaperone FlgA [Tabrizicola sp.]|uniref:flagellar basal body P-ring formation chaperone FlgA n=1 Tax=Tabrizicola sp. TaxID=2005166 RepID=UPI0026334A51|nr:flagellar basal body P-ring formation chaperone FlgA [Tabrizicola sp.]MDM7931824.1 flagellar basal body P-ring formation chaperone FlgA [Tabrizicola sp.]
MMWRALIILLFASPVMAESVIATRTIRAQTVIGPDDLTLVNAGLPGALSDTAAAIGLEARVAIYAGRPVRLADLGPPTLVQRNQVVALVYLAGGLAISTEGRALARGSEGEVIRVINLASRTTVSGRIGPNGAVFVGWEE